jgi:hypothetical protein
MHVLRVYSVDCHASSGSFGFLQYLMILRSLVDSKIAPSNVPKVVANLNFLLSNMDSDLVQADKLS